MFQSRNLQNFFIAVSVFAQVVSRTRSFQTNILHTSVPYNPQASLKIPYLQQDPSGSTWQFSTTGGVPTWIITTTVTETRNQTSNATATKDEDSPEGPNLREDAMTAGNEHEDPDLEFPIKHGKDPAVHARPAFGDPEKYEETTTSSSIEEEDDQTKTLVTVNRTTVVKIEFHNTPFLPLVLNVGNTAAATEPEKKNATLARNPHPKNYQDPGTTSGQESPNPSAQLGASQASNPAEKTDRFDSSSVSNVQTVPERIFPNFQFQSYSPYERTPLHPPAAHTTLNGVIYPYARFWRRK